MRAKPHFRIEDFAHDIGRTRTFMQLRATCISYLRARGAEMVSYHHLPPQGAPDFSASITIWTHGFPDDWVTHYISHDYAAIDPIPKHALSVTRPFWWSEAKNIIPGLNKNEKAYLKDLTEAQLGDGLAVPVFGPHARNGYVGVGIGHKIMGLTDAEILRIQWVCQQSHLRYCDLLREHLPEKIRLSAREREILIWVAQGKSNSVISQILDISTHTVDTYMRRIYEKFGVSDRVTAALRALSIGVFD